VKSSWPIPTALSTRNQYYSERESTPVLHNHLHTDLRIRYQITLRVDIQEKV